MKIKTLAITAGAVMALAGGLYLGSGAQAGTCTIGGETGPGVPVMLAAQSEPKQAAQKPTKEQGNTQKPGPAEAQPQADQGKKDQAPAQPKGAAPIVPIIAPDEGC
ncbi:MAG: hypothetical protein H5T99_11950 [Moorella sp. (in: Bacteria)]|nr:hypothetical protein [Moorella sp. (in: firmicutes)]